MIFWWEITEKYKEYVESLTAPTQLIFHWSGSKSLYKMTLGQSSDLFSIIRLDWIELVPRQMTFEKLN